MANYRKIWVDWTNKRLLASPTTLGTITLPAFHKYEVVPFQIGIIEPDPDDPIATYNRLSVANMSLRVVINDTLDDAAPLVEQASWTKNTATNVFTGELDLNTAGMNSYIGSSDTLTGYFEIQIVDNTCRSKIYRALVDLRQGVSQPTTTSPDPQQEYYTKAEMEGLFPRFLRQAGEQDTWTSPDGAYERTIGVSNDGEPIDIIAPT